METEQGHLWFKDAACNWYLSVMAELICLGCIQSKFDKAIFLLLSTDHLSVIFQTHMDDFTHVGKKVFQIKIMKQIEVTFKIGNTEEQSLSIMVSIYFKIPPQNICLSEYIYKIFRGNPSH